MNPSKLKKRTRPWLVPVFLCLVPSQGSGDAPHGKYGLDNLLKSVPSSMVEKIRPSPLVSAADLDTPSRKQVKTEIGWQVFSTASHSPSRSTEQPVDWRGIREKIHAPAENHQAAPKKKKAQDIRALSARDRLLLSVSSESPKPVSDLSLFQARAVFSDSPASAIPALRGVAAEADFPRHNALSGNGAADNKGPMQGYTEP